MRTSPFCGYKLPQLEQERTCLGRSPSIGHAETIFVLNNDVNVRMRAAMLKWQKVAEGQVDFETIGSGPAAGAAAGAGAATTNPAPVDHFPSPNPTGWRFRTSNQHLSTLTYTIEFRPKPTTCRPATAMRNLCPATSRPVAS
ncbi:hypothetical protein S40293_11111 [Stachybotrys chartarum IBT 40293]|nr:hypothetical protein S40293_11111 [Stachybotrys chartarum IBT 40293]